MANSFLKVKAKRKEGNLKQLVKKLGKARPMVEGAVQEMGVWADDYASENTPVESGTLESSWELILVGTEFRIRNVAFKVSKFTQERHYYGRYVQGYGHIMLPPKRVYSSKFSRIAREAMFAWLEAGGA